MPLFNCCSATLIGSKKKVKGDAKNRITKLQAKLENPQKSSEQKEPNTAAVGVSVSFNIPKNSRSRAKVVNHESPINREEVEVAYEGEDERDDRLPIWRDNTESNFQEFQFQNLNITSTDQSGFFSPELNQSPKSKKTGRDHHEDVDAVHSGHLSDPGTTKRLDDRDSPKLKRSCSNLETSELLKKIADHFPPTKSKSFNQLQHLAEKAEEAAHLPGTPCSHTSAFTHFSADKVILRKTSSSQVLPSRSRRLWWKLFLWSHRNLQKPSSPKPRKPTTLVSQNQQGGYSSDTLEPSWTKKLSKTGLLSPGAISEEHLQEDSTHYKEDCHASGWDRFQSRISGSWPQKQWLAFDMHSSPMKRVDEWVMNLEIQPADLADEIEKNDEVDNKGKGVVVPTPMTGRSNAGSIAHSAKYQGRHVSEDVLHANSVIQSLNSSSTVAHISGMGLKVIPSLSLYLRLRSVNLSNNCITHITNGSLPKSLHSLDLSRNKITTIEGLKELTRLRVLDLSYNRISRISQGLSNCTLLKELYLAGNKISEVEGLHRLLKLTLLDLSFNKIPTTKALGQLVANYNSLVALNLLGNPIQSTLSDDQLRKAVCGLLPKLAYLNKQLINPQKAREVATEIIAKASSGSGKRHSRNKPSRKGGYGGGGASGTVYV